MKVLTTIEVKDKEKRGGDLSQIKSYDKTLINISPKEWPAFLEEHAYLPDNSLNIELANAFAETATLMDFKRYIGFDHHQAPAGSPEEFLTFCSVLGYGVYLARYYDSGLLSELKVRANDPRKNIREAVVRALKNIGRKNTQRLLNYLDNWMDGSPLEQRAAIAVLCEPRFLQKPEVALMLLDILDWATASITEEKDWNNDYAILQKELEQAWSIAVTTLPAKGKMAMERWVNMEKPTVREVLRVNFEHLLMENTESEWAHEMLKKITSAK